MTTIPLYEMRLEEADACVVAVRSEREPVRRVRLAQTFLSDPALPREQRKAIQQLLLRATIERLRPSSSAPPPV